MNEGVLDGEIVAVDGADKPSFQSLQHSGRPGRVARPILYYAFDLLNLNGKTLVSLPLLERKRLLEHALTKGPHRVRFAGFLEGEAETIVAAICEHNLEGIVAKLVTSRYEPGKRSGAWV